MRRHVPALWGGLTSVSADETYRPLVGPTIPRVGALVGDGDALVRLQAEAAMKIFREHGMISGEDAAGLEEDPQRVPPARMSLVQQAVVAATAIQAVNLQSDPAETVAGPIEDAIAGAFGPGFANEAPRLTEFMRVEPNNIYKVSVMVQEKTGGSLAVAENLFNGVSQLVDEAQERAVIDLLTADKAVVEVDDGLPQPMELIWSQRAEASAAKAVSATLPFYVQAGVVPDRVRQSMHGQGLKDVNTLSVVNMILEILAQAETLGSMVYKLLEGTVTLDEVQSDLFTLRNL